MTPKEKAEELVDKFSLTPKILYHKLLTKRSSKIIAKMCVDEIISSRDMFRNYWIEVKEEIDKL